MAGARRTRDLCLFHVCPRRSSCCQASVSRNEINGFQDQQGNGTRSRVWGFSLAHVNQMHLAGKVTAVSNWNSFYSLIS